MAEAYKLSRYPQITDENSPGLRALKHDTTMFGIEASANRPIEKRITCFTLEMAVDESGRQRVINSALGPEDVETYYTGSTPVQRQESKAGKAMRDYFLHGNSGGLAIWISPPASQKEFNAEGLMYRESRVVVGYITKNDRGEKIMECYGICLKNSEDDCLEIGLLLGDSCDNEVYIAEPQDLRSQIFTFNDVQDPWGFSETFIDEPEIWRKISTGEAFADQQEVAEYVEQGVERILPLLVTARSEYEYMVVGAMLESYMQKGGWDISSGACGFTNTELLNGGRAAFMRGLSSPSEGSSEGKYVKNCGVCNVEIEKVIAPGYKCTRCGEVYLGVC